jgi:hypothetical protein
MGMYNFIYMFAFIIFDLIMRGLGIVTLSVVSVITTIFMIFLQIKFELITSVAKQLNLNVTNVTMLRELLC